MAKQSDTTREINKSDKKAVKMKKTSEIKTPAGGTRRSNKKLGGIKIEEVSSPKTRVTIMRELSQLKTPLAPMKMIMMKPPKIKAKKIRTPDELKEKSENNEGFDNEGEKEKEKKKKMKSSKRAAFER